MSAISRNVSASFSHGSVSATLTLENDDAESLNYALDDMFRVVSKGISRHLLVRLNNLVQSLEDRGGVAIKVANREPVIEKVEVTVFGTKVQFEIRINLDLEFKDELNKQIFEALPQFYAVGLVSSKVIEEAIASLAQRGGTIAFDQIMEAEHPLFAIFSESPFGGPGMVPTEPGSPDPLL